MAYNKNQSDRASGRGRGNSKPRRNQPRNQSDETSDSSERKYAKKEYKDSGNSDTRRSKDFKQKESRGKRNEEQDDKRTRDFKQKEYRGRKFEEKNDKPYRKPRNDKSSPRNKKFASKEDNSIRLNRYIAQTGFCSRREADTYITSGVVSINNKRVTELGTKVKPTDKIKINGELLSPEKNVYVLLNKPKDFVTTVEDPHATRTVMDLVKNACAERIYPVGRLDKNTTGVLLLTNDGKLTSILTHPKYNKKKIYQVSLNKQLTKNDMLKISQGLDLED
ncbi:MAG: hypothetical protein C0594_01225, partial [Marinilabiliales bacterium]